MKEERSSRSIPVFPSSQPTTKLTKRIPIMNSPDPILLMKKKKGKCKNNLEGYRFSFGGKQGQKQSKMKLMNYVSSSQNAMDEINDQDYSQPSLNKFKSEIVPKNLTPQFSSKKKNQDILGLKDQNKENSLSDVPALLRGIFEKKTLNFIAPQKNVEQKLEPDVKQPELNKHQSEASFADICLSEIERQNSQKELLVQSKQNSKEKKLEINQKTPPKVKSTNLDSVDKIQRPNTDNDDTQKSLLSKVKNFFHQPKKEDNKAQEKLVSELNRLSSVFQNLQNLKDTMDSKKEKDQTPNPPQKSTQKKIKFTRSTKKRSNKRSEKKVKYIPESFNAGNDELFPILSPNQEMKKFKAQKNQDQFTFQLFKQKKSKQIRPILQKDENVFHDQLFKNKFSLQKFRQLPGKNDFTQDDDINTVNFNGVNQVSYIQKISSFLAKHNRESKDLKLSPMNLLEDDSTQMKCK